MNVIRKSFLFYALVFGVFLMAASAPSPLYAMFQAQWHFSTIMLTIIFAVYALALLLTLLFFGRLSDYIGRRPVLGTALFVEAVSMILFAVAPNVTGLLLARVLQGFATGLVTAVAAAGLVDTQPPRTNLASIINPVSATASLGMGAMFSSILMTYAVMPTHLVFWLLCLLVVIAGVGTLFLPETVRPGQRAMRWSQVFRPVLAVPRGARTPLMTMGPSLIACWALTGLYLSLAPSVASKLLPFSMVSGIVIFAFTIPGACAIAFWRNRENAQLARLGAGWAFIGLIVTILGVASSNVAFFFMGSMISGIGFGLSLLGAFRAIMSQAPDDQRASLASTIYTISYLSLGLPAVIAGYAVTRIGLPAAFEAYGVIAILLYLMTLGLIGMKHLRRNSAS